MRQTMLDLFDEFKVVVFIPKDHAQDIIERILSNTVNQIGHYMNCMSWGDVTSTWTSLDGSKPFLGAVGERTTEAEIRLEFLCERTNLKNLIDIIAKIHPYEKAEIDILPVIRPDSLG